MEKRAWQRKEQDARRARVNEGIRVLAGRETGEMARVLHGLYKWEREVTARHES